MTAATEAAAVCAEQSAITRGWALWRRALQAEWPDGDRRVIGRMATDLREALDLYGAILSEEIHPASEWPELEDDPEAYASALGKASQDVTGWANELVRVLPAAAEGGE
jgi:hypothetical protein